MLSSAFAPSPVEAIAPYDRTGKAAASGYTPIFLPRASMGDIVLEMNAMTTQWMQLASLLGETLNQLSILTGEAGTARAAVLGLWSESLSDRHSQNTRLESSNRAPVKAFFKKHAVAVPELCEPDGFDLDTDQGFSDIGATRLKGNIEKVQQRYADNLSSVQQSVQTLLQSISQQVSSLNRLLSLLQDRAKRVCSSLAGLV